MDEMLEYLKQVKFDRQLKKLNKNKNMSLLVIQIKIIVKNIH